MANNLFNLPSYYGMLEKEWHSDEDIQKSLISQQVELVGWLDHIAEFSDVKVENVLGVNSDGNEIVQHKRNDGIIFTQGTPVNAENLGLMEWDIAILSAQTKHLMDLVNQLAIQVSILTGNQQNNMVYNSFIARVKDSTEIEVVEGYLNETMGRGEV